MILDAIIYFFSFILIMSFIVLIHELGHYLFARLFGVKIEEFSIGFGKELCGFTNRWNERVKLCVLPVGGYVKMFGDASEASNVASNIHNLSDKEKEKTFHFKPLWQKFLIVFAGPFANYLLSFILFSLMFSHYGQPYTKPIISQISPNSAAYHAGLKLGDNIVQIDGKKIRDFSDLQEIVVINPEIELEFTILREEKRVSVNVTPDKREKEDFFGNKVKLGFIGVTSQQVEYRNLDIFAAMQKSIYELYDNSVLTLVALKQIIIGKRDLSDLSGPLRIAQYSGQVTKKAFSLVPGEFQFQLILWFVAIISLNLGLVNLLPIPILDGGHLFLYMVEAVRRKSLSVKLQNLMFKISLSFLLLVFSFVLINDFQIVFG